MNKKTDNHNLEAKLELRRYFLNKYYKDNLIDVFDCCQGSGVIWSRLAKEFNLHSYWGVDVKAQSGRLKIDSRRILIQPGWPQNVIDIDTYGSPWGHYIPMLSNVERDITVFLTIGSTMFRGSVDKFALSALGINFSSLKLPESFCRKLSDLAIQYCIHHCSLCGVDVGECVESITNGNARYIGLRLIKNNVSH